jgi:hypothetical protein
MFLIPSFNFFSLYLRLLFLLFSFIFPCRLLPPHMHGTMFYSSIFLFTPRVSHFLEYLLSYILCVLFSRSIFPSFRFCFLIYGSLVLKKISALLLSLPPVLEHFISCNPIYPLTI